ncbi:MAG: hypothetical protein EP329_05105 [Deltaproteobacteria bacterium]|nr:MAG: hypothetical protein EP329_05105 [Deltaproteobacteria bacterium]
MNPLRVALALPLVLSLVASRPSAARADLPDLPDSAYDAACADARRVDGCPECTCKPLTSTSPIAEGASSPVRYAVALEVRGEDAQGHDVMYVHVALGDADRMVHAGQVAAAMQDYSSDITAALVASGVEQRLDRCEGQCEGDGVGLVHFFEVNALVSHSAIDLDRDETRERAALAACFAPEGLASAVCYLVPVEWKERVTTVPGGPGQGPRPISKRGWKRTWKIADKGGLHVALGPVKGKGDDFPEHKGAAKLTMSGLATAPGVVRAER